MTGGGGESLRHLRRKPSAHCLVGDVGGRRGGEAQCRAGPSRARPRWALAAAKQPRCNNSGTGGLKGDSLAGIGLQPRRPTLVDAETSPQTGGPECNRCKRSFPVYECLCVQTCGESAVETR